MTAQSSRPSPVRKSPLYASASTLGASVGPAARAREVGRAALHELRQSLDLGYLLEIRVVGVHALQRHTDVIPRLGFAAHLNAIEIKQDLESVAMGGAHRIDETAIIDSTGVFWMEFLRRRLCTARRTREDVPRSRGRGVQHRRSCDGGDAGRVRGRRGRSVTGWGLRKRSRPPVAENIDMATTIRKITLADKAAA
jgi:hypothetical protein